MSEGRRRIESGLRIFSIAALILLLIGTLLRPEGSTSEDVVRVGEVSGLGALTSLALDPGRASAVLWESPRPPTDRESALLRSLPPDFPVHAIVPDSIRTWSAEPLGRWVRDRSGALAVRAGSDEVGGGWVWIESPLGAVDSARFTATVEGRVEARFRVRPARAGWSEWRVWSGRDTLTVGRWVEEENRPVLVVATSPSWENRFAVRALEESGFDVEAAIGLGRGNAVVDLAPDRIASEYGAILLFTHARPQVGESDSEPSIDAVIPELEEIDLSGFVEAEGGGLLWVVGEAGWIAGLEDLDAVGLDGIARSVLARRGREDESTLRFRDHAGSAVRWNLPPEGIALPPWEGTVRSTVWDATGPGDATPGASVVFNGAEPGSGPGRLLELSLHGRGRIALTGLRESWRWRLDAGEVEAHRVYWESLVDWLSGGLRDSIRIEVERPFVSVGDPVEIRISVADPQATPGIESDPIPEFVWIRSPSRVDSVRVDPDPLGPGSFRARFTPDRSGVYTISTGGSDAVVNAPEAKEPDVKTAFRALDPSESVRPSTGGWAELGRIVAESGGASFRRTGGEATIPWPSGPSYGIGDRWAGPLRLVLAGALLLLILAPWISRRTRGLP